MTNPLLELKALGQSAWLDDIDREQLRSGLFGHLIDEENLSGATGNPTIFEHSITHGTTYDEQMQHLLRDGKSNQWLCENGRSKIWNASTSDRVVGPNCHQRQENSYELGAAVEKQSISDQPHRASR